MLSVCGLHHHHSLSLLSQCCCVLSLQEKLSLQERQMKLKGKTTSLSLSLSFSLPLSLPLSLSLSLSAFLPCDLCASLSSDDALSEAQKSLNKIRKEMLAWQSQYGDIRKELKEAEGTNETLRVSFCHGVITTLRALPKLLCQWHHCLSRSF